jgi:anti-sigma B factor antagonist
LVRERFEEMGMPPAADNDESRVSEEPADRRANEETMPPSFSLTSESIDDRRHVVTVAGEIDILTVPQLRAALREAMASGHTRIAVDLEGTSFLDSSALGVLVGAVKRLRPGAGVLAIVTADPQLVETFRMTGLDELFTICRTREEAVAVL